jgi:hypothetical protein
MALYDTFSFVKSFRGASSDEDRAQAIAQLVNGLVESNGAASATRADLARVAGDVVKIEQKIATLAEEVGQPVTQQLAQTGAATAKEIAQMRELINDRLTLVEQRLETLNRELGNRVEMNSDRVSGLAGRTVFWTVFFLLIFTVGGLLAALNWPAVQATWQSFVAPAPAAGTPTPGAPAAEAPAQPPAAGN